MNKRRLYLVQTNNRFGPNVYLPYSVGLLWAFAKQFPEITDVYEMCGFVYLKEPIQKALAKLDDPDLVAISLYIWNSEWSKAFAAAIKEKWPKCHILVGGVHIYDESPRTLEENAQYDFAIYGEGEGAFVDFLKEHAATDPDYSRVGSLIYRTKDTSQVLVNSRCQFTDLNKLRSPYLDGIFDSIFFEEPRWQILQETHRGCPYKCTFCLTESTSVSTMDGVKKIEDVVPDDQVLGWDLEEERLVWNTVDASVCVGQEIVLGIRIGEICVEATKEHLFWTREGWKEAGELQPGKDEVLSHMWSVVGGNVNSEGQAQKVLQQPLLDQIQGKGRKDSGSPSSRSKRKICRILPKKLRENEEKQSNEEGGCEKEAVCFFEEDDTRRNEVWGICSFHVYRARKEGHRRNCQEEAVRTKESDEESRFGKKDDCDSEKKGKLRQIFCSDVQKESNVQCQIQGESTKSITESACQKEIRNGDERRCSKDKKSSVKTSKQLREKSPAISGKKRTSFCFHRRLQSLDRPIGGRQIQKSRFYTYTRQESNSGTWNTLAQGYGEGETGSEGLQEFRMEMFYHLGGRRFGRSHDYTTQGVCWVRIDSIERVGTRRVYDIVNAYPTHNFFANGVLVSNCAWGASALTKVRPFPMQRVVEEIDWMGRNNTEYLDNADANFGILKDRDIEITKHLVETKSRYGYPKTFRTSFAKNSNERIWQIANMLHEANMLKSVTLAMQSMDSEVLVNIKRKNIKFDHFGELIKKYESVGISTYTELILGLAGETLETYIDGIEANLQAGQHSGLFMYLNISLPNTEQADPNYIKLFGLKSVSMQAMLTHGTPDHATIQERQDTIIETKAMPHKDWQYGYLFGKEIEIFHSQGLLQHVAIETHEISGLRYRDFYQRLITWLEENPETLAGREFAGVKEVLNRALTGGSWDCVDLRLGDISWPPEEFAFARICLEIDRFYDEIETFVLTLPDTPPTLQKAFLQEQRDMIIAPKKGKEEEWARENVWYGRKGYRKQIKRKTEV